MVSVFEGSEQIPWSTNRNDRDEMLMVSVFEGSEQNTLEHTEVQYGKLYSIFCALRFQNGIDKVKYQTNFCRKPQDISHKTLNL